MKIIFLIFSVVFFAACNELPLRRDLEAPEAPVENEESFIIGYFKKFATKDVVELPDPSALNNKYYVAGIESFGMVGNKLDYLPLLAKTFSFFQEAAFTDSANIVPLIMHVKDNNVVWGNDDLGLVFSKASTKDTHYRLEKFWAPKDNLLTYAQLIHFSTSLDKKNMSFSFSLPAYEKFNQSFVVVVYLAAFPDPLEQKAFHRVAEPFTMLQSENGQAYRLPPQEEVVFSFCTYPGMPKLQRENLSASIEQAVEDWKEVLGTKLSLRYRGERSDCEPPGNVSADYNIYVIPTVKTYGPGLSAGTYVYDRFKKTFLAGGPHILLFPQWSDLKWERKGPGLTGASITRHEMGHILGLGHQEKLSSTMSHYSPAGKLTDYDREAINALY